MLYTDGVNEAMDLEEGLFKDSRIDTSLESVPLDASAEFIVKNLMKNVSDFVGHAPQSDDITILTLRYLGSPARSRSAIREKCLKVESLMSGSPLQSHDGSRSSAARRIALSCRSPGRRFVDNSVHSRYKNSSQESPLSCTSKSNC